MTVEQITILLHYKLIMSSNFVKKLYKHKNSRRVFDHFSYAQINKMFTFLCNVKRISVRNKNNKENLDRVQSFLYFIIKNKKIKNLIYK